MVNEYRMETNGRTDGGDCNAVGNDGPINKTNDYSAYAINIENVT